MRLRWSGAALDDLDRIATFNEERSVEWAHKANRRIIERCNSLAHLPYQGRQIADTTARALSIPDVQYVVTYDLVGDDIRILRVRSAREIRQAK